VKTLEQITKQERLYLSLSPFTIPGLFSSGLGAALLPHLETRKRETVPKGFSFYQTEEVATGLFYLKKGVVIETLMNENGLLKDFLIFSPYLVGFNYCAHEQPIFPCTRAYTECEIYRFSYEEFLDRMQTDRALMKAVIKVVALDFRLANSLALQNQSCSTYEKVCQVILSYFIAGRYDRQARELKITQQLIAGLAGVHRVSVAHAVQRLKQDGIIGYTGRKLILLDEERLRTLAYGKYSIQ